MPTHLDDHPRVLPGTMFKLACPALFASLADHLRRLGERDLADQLSEVFVPPQVLNGSPHMFSFLAYAVPRLNFEQRRTRVFADTRSVAMDLAQGHVRIDIDEFGMINWFYTTALPQMFDELVSHVPTPEHKRIWEVESQRLSTD
jgi:hypothetical protein